MSIMYSALLLVCLSLGLPAQLNAQKGWGKLARYAGKVITTELIGSAVETGLERLTDQYFGESGNSNYPYQSRAIQVYITNDFYYTAYFWISTDGEYWHPYEVRPGGYISIRSGPSGAVAICDGYGVAFMTRPGNYTTSSFYY